LPKIQTAQREQACGSAFESALGEKKNSGDIRIEEQARAKILKK